MSEDTKKVEQIEQEAKESEISNEDLDNVAGGMAGLSHAAIAGMVIGGAAAASLGIASGVGASDSASRK